MRIEVTKQKVEITTVCDVCKVVLTPKNIAYHAKEDHRHGAGASLDLSIYISFHYDQRSLKDTGITGDILEGKIDMCKKCHRAVIQWYLDHIEPGSGI